MSSSFGKLVVLPQAKFAGVKPGPYEIKIYKTDSYKIENPVAVQEETVLGSVNTFFLPPGEYTVDVYSEKEGTFSQVTYVSRETESVVTLKIGTSLPATYHDLLINVQGSEEKFENFLQVIAKDDRLRRDFLENPNKSLQQAGLLETDAHLSKQNTLFVALLANKDIIHLIRKGPKKIDMPDDYLEINKKKIKNLAQKINLPDELFTEEVSKQIAQERYYLEVLLENVLTSPIISNLYNISFKKGYIQELTENSYDALETINTSDLKELVNKLIPKITDEVHNIIYIFVPASQDTKLDVGFGFGITSTAVLYVDTAIFTNEYIFTNTHFFFEGKKSVIFEPEISKNFRYFSDFTASKELGDLYDIDQLEINEIYNISRIADSIIEGMKLIDLSNFLNNMEKRQ